MGWGEEVAVVGVEVAALPGEEDEEESERRQRAKGRQSLIR